MSGLWVGDDDLDGDLHDVSGVRVLQRGLRMNLKIEKGFFFVGTRGEWPFPSPADNVVIEKDVTVVFLPEGATVEERERIIRVLKEEK